MELVGLGCKQKLFILDALCSTSSVHAHRRSRFKDAEFLSLTAVKTFVSRIRETTGVTNLFQNSRGRTCPGDWVLAGASRCEATSHTWAGSSRSGGRVVPSASVGLASDSTPMVDKDTGTEAESLDLKEILAPLNPLTSNEEEENTSNPVVGSSIEEGNSPPMARAVPWIPAVEAGTLVSEVILEGDELRVQDYSEKEDNNPAQSIKEAVLNIGGDGREFSLSEVGGLWKTGKRAGEAQVPDLSASMYDVRDGVAPLAQWTSTELTMQHSQLARIATDVYYLQNAFAFFGAVRVAEALLTVFATSPPDFGKLKELLNALDPLTISWLAFNLRQPIEGILEVDPVDLERVMKLKGNLWEELHKFYERQWKVMATIAMARTLGIVVSHVPSAEVITGKVKFLWDALMALPVF